MKTLSLLAGLLLAFALHAAEDKPDAPGAPDPAAARSARRAAAQKLLDRLKPQQGEVDLRSGLAKATIPAKFRYLSPADADTVLYDLWGNPPSTEKTLGLIYPADESLADPGGWAVVLEYEEDGHVKDDDATTINYDKLLKEMQKGAESANEERTKQGYPTVELVGWAAPPHYDQTTHKIYWAKELKFGDNPGNTLNYNLRMLGRRGVLILNAVAPMSRLKDIETATPEILAMVDFNAGQRYGDFDSSTDKVATYGLAALVAGGVAMKMGLFKGLLVALVAAKKFVVLGVIALVGFVKKLFGGKKNGPTTPTALSPNEPPPYS
jgi:uncharacterized membrane-anchored protein